MASQIAKRIHVHSGVAYGAAALVALSLSQAASGQAARDYISIVGSSTVYPFSTIVAEHFGRASAYKTPKVEATGTGGGLQQFCAGIGVQHPDVANASRRILPSELERCIANGVEGVIEIKIGYDGIVLANAIEAQPFELTLRQIYLALAQQVPDPSGADRLVPNPYRRWSELDAGLPDNVIEVLGPPPTSGTRDAFVELAMQGGCGTFERIAALDEGERAAACERMREDGRFIEAGENDNLIVQKIDANPAALGIFGFSFLEQNTDKVQAARVNGVEPTFDTIADGEYPISRPLYFYAKSAHLGAIPGLNDFLHEFVSEDATGEFGYLSDAGLIPLPAAERRKVVDAVENLETLMPEDLREGR